MKSSGGGKVIKFFHMINLLGEFFVNVSMCMLHICLGDLFLLSMCSLRHPRHLCWHEVSPQKLSHLRLKGRNDSRRLYMYCNVVV